MASHVLPKIVLSSLAFILTQMILAEPARRVPFTVIQQDGSQLTLCLIGDEHFHCLVTGDNIPVVAVDNVYYYAEVHSSSLVSTGLLAHDAGDRDVKEKAFCGENRDAMCQKVSELWAEGRQMRSASLSAAGLQNSSKAKSSSQLRKAVEVSNSNSGSQRGLVLLVNFADLEMVLDGPQATFDAAFNDEGYSENYHIGSVHDYFYDQSYGQFDLTFDVVGPITVSNNYTYYGKNSQLTGNDKYPATMVAEACRLADSQVDFSDYDWDGDGEVEQVFIVYAGYAESSGASSNTIWPHRYNLSSASYYGDGEGAITLDGVVIDQYACSSELAGFSGTTMRGIGTACHEFGHCFGLPDIYDTDYSGGFGMDSWDIMSGGSYNGPNGNGEVPCGYSAMERYLLGWLTLEELSSKTEITGMPCLGDEPVAYAIYNEGNRDEFFTLENRQNTGWFTYVYTYDSPHGLLVSHIDYNATIWDSNDVNNNPSHQRMTIIPADGDYDDADEDDFCGDPFPGSYGVTELSNTSHYSAGGKLFNANDDGTYYMNMPIYDITEEDGLISFRISSHISTPTVGSATDITTNSFTANWEAVEGADRYAIELSQVNGENIGSIDVLLSESFSNFITPNNADGSKDLADSLDNYTSEAGWKGYKIFTSSYGAKIGTSSENGYLRTPVIENTNNYLSLSFSGRSYSGSGCLLSVNLSKYSFSFTTMGTCEVELTKDIDDYVVCFTDVDPAKYKVEFAPESRAYISNLEILDGYTEGKEACDTVANITDTSYTFTGLEEASTYAYRVKAIVDDYETVWSIYSYVSLSEESGIADVFVDETAGTEQYYTLDGLKVSSPKRKGLYILRQGAGGQSRNNIILVK